MKTISKLLIFILLIGMVACNKDANKNEPGGNGTEPDPVFSVKLVDLPTTYDAVNIEILSMKAKIDSTWYEFPAQEPAVYNLLDFTNGNNLLLVGDTSVAPGMMTELRLILGTDNTVVIDSVSYPMQTPSGQSSGYKIKMDEQLMVPGGVYSVVIDFDVNASVHETGNGKFMLKPVVRGYLEDVLGGISGVVVPPNGAYYVEAVNATDTAGTMIDTLTGEYLLSTVVPGTYNLNFSTNPGFSDTTLTNIGVVVGQVTQVDTLFLAQ